MNITLTLRKSLLVGLLVGVSSIQAGSVKISIPLVYADILGQAILPDDTPPYEGDPVYAAGAIPIEMAGRDLSTAINNLISVADVDPINAQMSLINVLNYGLPLVEPTAQVGNADNIPDALDALLNPIARKLINTYITPTFIESIPKTYTLLNTTPDLEAPGIVLNGVQTTTIAGQGIAEVIKALVTLASSSPQAAIKGILMVLNWLGAAVAFHVWGIAGSGPWEYQQLPSAIDVVSNYLGSAAASVAAAAAAAAPSDSSSSTPAGPA